MPPGKVRFGSLADVRERIRDVRFTPKCSRGGRVCSLNVMIEREPLNRALAELVDDAT